MEACFLFPAKKKDYSFDPPQTAPVQTKTFGDEGDISSQEAVRVASLFNTRERKARNATIPSVQEVIPIPGADNSSAMRGDKKKFLFITYDGHAWVCDGLNEKKISKEYYLEVVSPLSPLQYKQVGTGSIGEGYTDAYYHMSWGWHDTNANGWYADMNIYVPSQQVDFKHDRQDIINIIPNK